MAMYTIHICVRCSDTSSESHIGDGERTELIVESVLGTALLEVFDTVLIENITVQHPQKRDEEDRKQAA